MSAPAETEAPGGGPHATTGDTAAGAAHADVGDLTSPRVVRDLLARHGLRHDKDLGQHFLVDRRTLRAIVEGAEIGPSDHVWEVGPGLGTLTRELAARAARVVAIEIDARLPAVLAETLAPWPHAEVRRVDALRVDWAEAAPGSLFVANLPYQAGTAVITRVVGSRRFARLVVLVQREVAERLVAGPGEAAFGSLSLWIAHHGRARLLRGVPPGAFLPPPRVHSAIVRIDVDPHAGPDPRTFALIRDAFRHRRKTLAWNLRAAGDDPERVGAALAALAIDPRARAETLGLATFRRLAAALRVAAGVPEPPT